MAEEPPLLTMQQVADGIAQLVCTGVIDVNHFRLAYNEARPPSSSLFAVFEVEAGGDVAAVPLAVIAAWEKFCVNLVERLLLLVSSEALENEDLRRIVHSLGTRVPGRIQSVLRSQGPGLVRTLTHLIRSARATALIRTTSCHEKAPTYGTGFLVGPDLVLTAAHVVASLMDGDVPRAGSEQDASIEFHNQLEGAGPCDPGSDPVRIGSSPRARRMAWALRLAVIRPSRLPRLSTMRSSSSANRWAAPSASSTSSILPIPTRATASP